MQNRGNNLVIHDFKFLSTFICNSQLILHELAGILSLSPIFEISLTGRGKLNIHLFIYQYLLFILY